MTVHAALDTLRSVGTVALCEGRIALEYPLPAPPAVAEAIDVLRRNRLAALALLKQRPLAAAPWSAEALDSERRFRCPEARLYHLLGHEVETPEGRGKLLGLVNGAEVLLDRRKRTSRFPVGTIFVRAD